MFVCGIFVDLQKAFDTVDYNILFHKLSHFGIRDIANCIANWFWNTVFNMGCLRGLFWVPSFFNIKQWSS